MSPTLAVSVTVAASLLNDATDRDAIRQILTGWRTANWDAWVAEEAAAHASDAAHAAEVGDHHALEKDGSWRVDYLPRALHFAEAAALARCPASDAPAVYTRARD